MTAEENKAFIRRWVELIQCSGPESAVQACNDILAPDFVNHTPMGMPSDASGVKMFMAALWNAFPDCHATIHDQIAEGDAVVTRKTISGTHQGEFMGIPATGKPVNIDVIDILTVRDGKITSHHGMVDQVGLMQQLGVM